MIRHKSIINQPPSPTISQEPSNQDDHKRVHVQSMGHEETHNECAYCHRVINLDDVLQSQYDLCNEVNTTEKHSPVVTHVMPIVSRWIPGLSR